jgi:ribosomal protein L29
MAQPLLEGNIDRRNEIISQLQAENDRLNDELTRLRVELARTQNEGAHAISNLRRILAPLYQGLQQIFGEIDRVSLEADLPTTDVRKSAAWDLWKQKLGGKQAEFIQALLDHGEMTAVQLKITTRCGQQTVYDTIFKLNRLGLINKNGGKISLKQL